MSLEYPLIGHSNRINHMLCLGDKLTLLSSSNDCTVRQWNIVTGTCDFIYKFADPIAVTKVREDINFMFTASWDKMVRVIDREKNLVTKSFVASKESIKEMLVTDKYIIVAGCDPIIRAYNLENG
mmetsp:Transcript_55074/g.75685  ORF Transcript_55074/g.75685 Transcript_55074/m.75685 type:complete len:125 (+) Transcript_55074:193-567(+)